MAPRPDGGRSFRVTWQASWQCVNCRWSMAGARSKTKAKVLARLAANADRVLLTNRARHLARTDGPKSGVFDCPGVETLVVEKGATCRVCGFATTMVPADLPYPELVKLFDTHTCKEKPV